MPAVLGKVLAALLCVTALVSCDLVGLGDDDEPTAATTPPPTLTKKEFLKRGNTICRNGSKKLRRIDRRIDPNDQDSVISGIRDGYVPTIRGQVRDLRALRAPAGVRRTLLPVLADTDRVLDRITEDPAVITDPKAFRSINRRLIRLGLTECGKD